MIGRVFKTPIAALEHWRMKKRAFATLFGGPYGDEVLTELADFCHAFKTTEDPQGREHITRMREGRRQVFLFIQHRLNLTPAQLSTLYRDIINDNSGDE